MCIKIITNFRGYIYLLVKGISFLFVLGLSGVSYSLASIIDPAERLEREERQRMVQQELSRLPERVRLAEDSGALRFKSFSETITVHKIELLGSELLRNMLLRDGKNYLRSYENRFLKAQELNDFLLELNNLLFKRGYITSRLEIAGYDLKRSILSIRVQEGRVEELKMSKANRYTLFPGMLGRKLRASDLEQGLEQFNRLSSQRGILSLWPGKEVGGSMVSLEFKPIAKPYRLSLTWDNSGDRHIGYNTFKANFNYDNLLKLNDQLSLVGSKSGFGEDRSTAITWKEEMPIGYYTLGYSGSYSDSQYDIHPGIKETQSITNSLKNKLNLSKVIYRNQNHKISLDTSFWHYIPHRKIGGIDLLWTQQKLSVLDITARHEFYCPDFRIFTELNYAQGTKLFGAHKNLLSNRSIYSQRRYKLTSDYLWQVANTVHLNGNLQLQYAANGLHGTLKLPMLDEIGGVRGSRTDALTLDDGAILRHDIIFPKIIKRAVISPFLHGDLGFGRDKESFKGKGLYGAVGAGIKLDLWEFHGRLTISKLLVKPRDVDNRGIIFLFELSRKILG